MSDTPDTPFAMRTSRLLQLLLWLALILSSSSSSASGNSTAARSGCEGEFQHKCHCGKTAGDVFTTNCTNTEFKDASLLAHINPETEQVVFTGNDFAELPDDLFGIPSQFYRLVSIDLSGNHIRLISNGTFDERVSAVEKLVLSDNDWVISKNGSVFHAFKSLRELHLAGAFSKELTTADVFGALDAQFTRAAGDGTLENLRVLHLENNLLDHFNDDSILCHTPSLTELYLGNNRIVSFKITFRCARRMEILDLSGNLLKRLSDPVVGQLKLIPLLKVDLSDNAFFCDCKFRNTSEYLVDDHTRFVNSNKYKCDDGYPTSLKGKSIGHLQKEDLKCLPTPLLEEDYPRAGLVILAVILVIVAGLVAGLVYLNRVKVGQCLRSSTEPILRKFEYSSIGRKDENEVDV